MTSTCIKLRPWQPRSAIPIGTGLVLSLTLVLLTVSAGHAQAACPEGNLLAGKQSYFDGASEAARANDGIAVNEGDPWNSEQAAVLHTRSAQLMWDLGQPTRIRAAWIQADHNDTYTLSVSNDNRRWRTIWVVEPVAEKGLRARFTDGLDVTARYVRVSDVVGDDSYTVTEVQLFCALPTPWPPQITREQGIRDQRQRRRQVYLAYSKFAVAMCGLVLFSFLRFRPRDETFWTVWGPYMGGGGLATLAALQVHGFAGAVVAIIVLAAAGLLVGRRWPVVLQGAHLQYIGLVLAAAATAYTWLGISKFYGEAMANLSGGYVALIIALRYAGRPWARPVPLLAGVAAAGFAGYQTYGIAVAGAVVVAGAAIGWLLMRRLKQGQIAVAAAENRLERTALVLLMAACAHTWPNFADFHGGGGALHIHEMLHYYLGSKYFRENSYTRLYQCAALAEFEEGRARQVTMRRIRDLETNQVLSAEHVLRDPQVCRDAFSAARWVAFQNDLRLLRNSMLVKSWERVFTDHGYNAAPVWNALGSLLTNYNWQQRSAAIPVGRLGERVLERRLYYERQDDDQLFSQRQRFLKSMRNLALIDIALYAGLFALIGWAFGLRSMALAILVWSTGFPWVFSWTGGAFARVPWLFMAVAGMCLLKKRHHVLGGAALTWSLLLRLFPAALGVGMACKLVWNLWHRRTVTRPHRHFIAGALIAAALLIPLGAWVAGGWDAYPQFVANTLKHSSTPVTNHMGLRTLLSWSPDAVAAKTRDPEREDAFAPWKQARKDTLQNRIWLYWVLVAATLAFVFILVRNREDWESVALSTVLITALFELTCYYYSFFILLAPLMVARMRWVVAYIAVAGISQVIHLQFSWGDERYVAQSILFLGFLIGFLTDLAIAERSGRDRGDNDNDDDKNDDDKNDNDKNDNDNDKNDGHQRHRDRSRRRDRA